MKTNQSQNNIPMGWCQIKLGEVADPKKKWSFTGGPFGSNLKQSSYVETGVRIIQLQNIGDGKFIDNYKIFTTAEKADELLSCNIYPGEIILSKMGDPVARACIIPKTDKRYLMASDGIRLAPNTEKFNTYFIFLAINSLYFRVIAENSSTGSTRKRIGLSVLRKLKLLVPELPEQNRIVSVLETGDKIIEKLIKKIEVKKQIKQGLMQNLLTGKKRLAGFRDEWKNYAIGELGEYYSGITGKNKEDFGFGSPFISYMNIYLNSKINTDIRDLVNIKDGEKQNKVKYGDLFFTTSSETPDEVGVASVLLDKNIGEIYLNSFCFGFRLNNFYKLIPEFAQYYFRTRCFRKSMFEIAQGATRFNLSKKYFIQIIIKIPNNIEEQRAIADIFTTIDNEINKLDHKLSLLKDQKKYLLNNLITGKIRTTE